MDSGKEGKGRSGSASGSWAFDLVGNCVGRFGRYREGVVVLFHGIWRAAVVVVAPNTIPGSCNGHKTNKHNRGVVHGIQGDGLHCGHTKQWDREQTPGYERLAHTGTEEREKPTESEHVGNQADGSAVEAALLDILATAKDQRDSNRTRITHC